MRGPIKACLAVGFVIFAFLVLNTLIEAQSPQKLDCKKMVNAAIEAMKNRDFKAFCRIGGLDSSKEDEAEFKQSMDQYEQSGAMAGLIDRLSLFPKIGEIPNWATKVKYESKYLEGNSRIELEVLFEMKKVGWTLENFDAREKRGLTAEEREESAVWLSPSPLEGEKTFDAGLTELFKKVIRSLKDKAWETARRYLWIWEESDEEDTVAELIPLADKNDAEITNLLAVMQKNAGGKLFMFLEQFPSIGLIPGPAETVGLEIQGMLKSIELKVNIGFGWFDGNTRVEGIEVLYGNIE